jgi:hypothetical protein
MKTAGVFGTVLTACRGRQVARLYFSRRPTLFCGQRDARDKYAAEVAKNTYGDNYEQVIKQDIDRRYQAKSQQEAKGQAAQDKTGGKKDMFNFKKDKAQRQPSSQNSSQQSGQDKAKAFRQSLKADTSKQQQAAAKKAPSQSNSSSQNGGAPSAPQRERARGDSSSSASKYKAAPKPSSPSKSSSSSQSKGGQTR